MKHQRQGYNECKLATVAMLSDTPLNKIREIACHAANVTTWGMIETSDDKTFFNALTVVLDKIHPKPKGKVLLFDDIDPLTNNSTTSATATTKKYLSNEKLPLQGKGEIFVRWENGKAHSIVYENDVIFDPALDKEYPFSEWLKLPNIKDTIKYFIM